MRIAGQLMSAEGYANLGELFEQDLKFDPHVRRRVLLGRDTGAAKYIALLKAGGTLRHKELLAPFGLDAGDPAFWNRGLEMIAGFIAELEKMG